jgi:hypothetical protein
VNTARVPQKGASKSAKVAMINYLWTERVLIVVLTYFLLKAVHGTATMRSDGKRRIQQAKNGWRGMCCRAFLICLILISIHLYAGGDQWAARLADQAWRYRFGRRRAAHANAGVGDRAKRASAEAGARAWHPGSRLRKQAARLRVRSPKMPARHAAKGAIRC